MLHTIPQKNDNLFLPGDTLFLKYEGEDDRTFMVSDSVGRRVSVPKKRNVPTPFLDPTAQPLIPAYRLLALAFVGLAPAGLLTLILAPLAGLWALWMLSTRPLSPADNLRVVVVWGLAAGLLAIAIPLSKLFLVHYI
jgi:hypothetical protein